MKKSILIAIMMMAFMITGCSSEDYYVEENDGKTVIESSEVEEQESYKELYLKKLAELDEETDRVYGQTLAMTQLNISMGELAKKWDDMLNEIYGVLNNQLSASEIDELDQEAWLKYRDEEAKKARDEYEGGTMAPTMYNDTKIYYTKERCYLLVNDYMK